jgi:hypothetical protein
MKANLALVHTGLAWLVVIGSILQFFMIALTIFNGVSIAEHANTGRMLTLAAALMLIVALIIRTSRRTTWFSVAVLLLLFPIQGVLAYVDMPGVLKSLHAVTGTLILWLAYSLAAGSARAVVEQKPAAVQLPAD